MNSKTYLACLTQRANITDRSDGYDAFLSFDGAGLPSLVSAQRVARLCKYARDATTFLEPNDRLMLLLKELIPQSVNTMEAGNSTQFYNILSYYSEARTLLLTLPLREQFKYCLKPTI